MIFWINFITVILAMIFLASVLGVDRTDAAITIAILAVIAPIFRNIFIHVRESLLSKIVGDTHIHAD